MSESTTTAAPTIPQNLPDLIAELRTLLPDLRARHGVASLAVFGSRVRHDFTPHSDLDLLATFERPIGLFELIGLEQELSDHFGVKVDLGTPTSIKALLRDRILASAVPV